MRRNRGVRPLLSVIALSVLLAGLTSPNAEADTLLVSQTVETSSGFGYGYGNFRWTNMTAALNSAFGDRVTVTGELSNRGYLMGFDALWLDQRWTSGMLSPTEIANITAFVKSGKKSVLIGENNGWTPWNSQILGIVGGRYAGEEGDGPAHTVFAHDTTAGVSTIDLTFDGVAVGGTALFTQNVATLWGRDLSTLTWLTVNVQDDDFWENEQNALFATNVAEWLAKAEPAPTPDPATMTLTVVGLAGLFLRRRSSAS